MCEVLPQNHVNCLRNWSPEFLVSPSGRNLNVTAFQICRIQNSGLGVPGTLDMLRRSLKLQINHFQTLVSSEQSPPLRAAVSCSLEHIIK